MTFTIYFYITTAEKIPIQINKTYIYFLIFFLRNMKKIILQKKMNKV